MGYSQEHYDKAKQTLQNKIDVMKSHPNWKQVLPEIGETKTNFILRSIGNLISPPMTEGESYEVECIDIKDALMGMEKELEETWNKYNRNGKH